MPQTATAMIQLIHIRGPMKGQSQAFSEFPVSIGRHPTCHVRFDRTQTTISRQHARIERQGNRFRIIDTSTNGTFVNGKRIADIYLRDGDAITFSPEGPKANFIAQFGTDHHSQQSSDTSKSAQVPSDAGMTMGPAMEIPVTVSEKPLMIQYGEKLKTYSLLPITIGSDNTCDFVIPGDTLAGCHIQFFFWENDYYVKDLTGENLVTINGRPIGDKSVLATGAELSLSKIGPRFRFLEGGRLAHIREP